MLHLRQRFPATMISIEVEKPNRAGLQELAAEADVVFYSKGWAQVSPH
jgi:ketohexokinase